MQLTRIHLAAGLSILACATFASGAQAARHTHSTATSRSRSRHACLSSAARSRHGRAARRERRLRPACRLRTFLSRPKLRLRQAAASIALPKLTAAEARASKIATVLATACQNTELMPEASDLPLIRAAVLCLINRERAQDGEVPLIASRKLEAAAEEHSQELIEDDYFAHISPGGVTPVDRIRATGYIPSSTDGYVIGENLAWGTLDLATPQAIVAAWIASPEHLANILEAKYTETGVGVAPSVPASLSEGAPGGTYAQEFGVIIR